MLGAHHVVERVVERAEIGIDLFLHVAGQEAEALAGLDRGTREDDAVDVAALEQRRGMGHREIGLAGTGRADAEDQLGAIHRAHVRVLRRRTGDDRRLARRDLRHPHLALLLKGGERELAVLGLDHADHRVDVGNVDRTAFLEQRVERLEDAAALVDAGVRCRAA